MRQVISPAACALPVYSIGAPSSRAERAKMRAVCMATSWVDGIAALLRAAHAAATWSKSSVQLQAGTQSHGCALTERVAELHLVLVAEFVQRETLVLGSGMRDLQRAHQRCNASNHRPVEPAQDAENQPRAIGIAAAGGIDHVARLGSRNGMGRAFRVDHRSFGTVGHDV